MEEENKYNKISKSEKTGGKYKNGNDKWWRIYWCRVDEKSLSDYGNEKFTTLILWKITWFGYDEKMIQDRLKSLFEDEDVWNRIRRIYFIQYSIDHGTTVDLDG